MKIARLNTDDGVFYAELKNDGYHLILGDVFAEWGVMPKPYEGNYKLLAPCTPSKVVCFGANYLKHADELHLAVNSEPTIFLKPPTAVIAHGDSIIYPKCATRVEYESELAVVIGKTCHNITSDEAAEYIFGYTCACDVTERDMQHRDGQWTRAKGFDTFCPLGPCICTDDMSDSLMIVGRKNGVEVQHTSTSEMIHTVADCVAFVSGIMTLYPGDVLLTGTPEGIGELAVGDTFEVQIDGIGTLCNTVVKED